MAEGGELKISMRRREYWQKGGIAAGRSEGIAGAQSRGRVDVVWRQGTTQPRSGD
jgi:hypothetical protein